MNLNTKKRGETPSQRFALRLVGAVVCLSFVLAAGCSRHKASDMEVLGFQLLEIKEAPAFAGVNFTGDTVRSDVLRGKVWVAYFMFTSCGGPCPKLNARVAEFQASLKNVKDARFVAFSVDPDNDTPEVLAQYAARFRADASRWFMLRLPLDSVQTVAEKGFLLKGPDNTPDMHSTRLVLVDKRGVIRGYFNGLDEKETANLGKAIEALSSDKL